MVMAGGPIETKLTGDASGAVAAVSQVLGKYTELMDRQAKLRAGMAELGGTSKFTAEQQAVLSGELARVQAEVNKLTGADKAATDAAHRLAEITRTVAAEQRAVAEAARAASAAFQAEQTAQRGLIAAAIDVTQRIDQLENKSEQLHRALLDDAFVAGLTSRQLRALADAADAARMEIAQLESAERSEAGAARARANIGGGKAGAIDAVVGPTAQQNAAKMKERIEKVVSATNSFGGALGAAGGEVGKLGAAVGNAFGAFGATGVVGLALAAAAAGVGLLVSKWSESQEAAKEASATMADASKKIVDDLSSQVDKIQGEIADLEFETLMVGLTSVEKEMMRGLVSVEKATKALRAFEEQYGIVQSQPLAAIAILPADPFQAAVGAKPTTIVRGIGSEMDKEAEALRKTHTLLQDIVRLQYAKAEAAKASAKATKEEADANAKTTPVYDYNFPRYQLDMPGQSDPRGAQSSPLGSSLSALDAFNAAVPDRDDVAGFDAWMESFKENTYKFEEFTIKIDDGTVAFASTVDELAKFRDALIGLDAFMTSGEWIKAIGSGKGGNAAGSQIGAAVGAVASMALGDPTGATGGAIGALIGGVLGDALDALVESLGVLTPLFDGVAVLIGGLSPILDAFKEGFTAIGMIIGAFAPVLHAFAAPLAEIAMLFANLLLTLAPIIVVALHVVAALLEFGVSTSLFRSYFDDVNEGWSNGLKVLRQVLNGFVTLYNAIIDKVRTALGLSDFGTKMELFDSKGKFSSGGLDTSSALRDNTAAVDRNTKAMAQELTNIPTGYKISAALFAAETPRNEEVWTKNGIEIGTVQIIGSSPGEFERWARTLAASTRGNSKSVAGRSSFPDRTN